MRGVRAGKWFVLQAETKRKLCLRHDLQCSKFRVHGFVYNLELGDIEKNNQKAETQEELRRENLPKNSQKSKKRIKKLSSPESNDKFQPFTRILTQPAVI